MSEPSHRCAGGKAELPVPSEEIGTPEQTVGHPGLWGVTGLVHSNFYFFFSFFLNVCSFIFLFWGLILTLEQDKSTSSRKLNLHFIFNCFRILQVDNKINIQT